jgi:hypothetical protein
MSGACLSLTSSPVPAGTDRQERLRHDRYSFTIILST